ncbi:MAG: DUF4476 domain-containing protein [Bacteroidetes bacterium]|nr:DUF4476 domain-containing protein [Bacteroidota bacterium]
MKTKALFFLVFFFMFLGGRSIAQISNVVVFAPKGEKFTLHIGSTISNSEPASRVEADNPGGPSFKIKIAFSDPSVKEISKLVFNKPHGTMFFKVVKNQKGVYVIESTSYEYMDDGVAAETPPPPPPPSGENKSTADTEKDKKEPEKSTDKKGCDNPISDPDFSAELVGISARPFEPMQLSAAKKRAETHCLMVKMVIYIFDSESSRISFAKYAYDYTYDRHNYAEVKDALHSQKSKDDLDRFIAGKTK